MIIGEPNSLDRYKMAILMALSDGKPKSTEAIIKELEELELVSMSNEEFQDLLNKKCRT